MCAVKITHASRHQLLSFSSSSRLKQAQVTFTMRLTGTCKSSFGDLAPSSALEVTCMLVVYIQTSRYIHIHRNTFFFGGGRKEFIWFTLPEHCL